MTLEPILAASPAIQVHAAAAISAFAVGTVQLARPKGGPSHRMLGWVWIALMVIVAGSGFFIHQIDTWRGWSPIHLLSLWTLAMLPLAVVFARRGNFSGHSRTMIGLFIGALVVAGLFTALPGRIIGRMLFG